MPYSEEVKASATATASSDSKRQSKASQNKVKGAAMATIQDDDERLLAQIGYEQV